MRGYIRTAVDSQYAIKWAPAHLPAMGQVAGHVPAW